MQGYPYGWYPPAKPPSAPGETYHKVLGIITVIAASLLLLGGLLIVGITALLWATGNDQDLSILNLLVMSALAALAGGGFGLYHSIRALNHFRSAPFSLPSFWTLVALTVIILGAGIALFALNLPTGPVALIEPLVLLGGVVPAIAILAVGLQVLKPSVSWRHAFLALTTGATVAIGAASILELILTVALLGAASLSIDPSNFNPNSSFGVAAILILVSVIAPLVEETTKQISGFFLLPRMRGPQEAFLIGLAAGIGFAMLETAGYIGMAQADWVGIALGRVGAGLLHGMGAAMAGVGWYYLFRGKGVRGRWRIGILCLIYAYVQHAIFNGGQVVLLLIPLFQNWHVDFFGLRLDITSVYAGGLYLIILGIMLRMIHWLRTSAPAGVPPAGVGTPVPIEEVAPAPHAAGASNGGPIARATLPDTLRVGEQDSREPGGIV
jgi:RsiW-degrading membrane proteinase PrsW (M82 family)